MWEDCILLSISHLHSHFLSHLHFHSLCPHLFFFSLSTTLWCKSVSCWSLSSLVEYVQMFLTCLHVPLVFNQNLKIVLPIWRMSSVICCLDMALNIYGFCWSAICFFLQLRFFPLLNVLHVYLFKSCPRHCTWLACVLHARLSALSSWSRHVLSNFIKKSVWPVYL